MGQAQDTVTRVGRLHRQSGEAPHPALYLPFLPVRD